MSATPDIPGPDSAPRQPRNALPPLSCDTHAHLFGPDTRFPYGLNRSYTPPDALRQDYVNLLHTLGFQRAVLVQPSVYGIDNRLMCDVLSTPAHGAEAIEWRGIAVLDTSVTDVELERLDKLGVRGVRLNMLFRGGIDFATASILAGRIAPLGWHLQFLVDISRFEGLASRLATLPVDSVIDHMGHFPAALGPTLPAFRDLLALLKEGRTWVKVTGPNRISASDSSPFNDAEAIARKLVDSAPERLVFGTDWPHVQIPTSIPNDGDLVDEFFRWIDNDQKLAHQILVDNPAQLYSFGA